MSRNILFNSYDLTGELMDVPLWVWFAFVGGVVALLGVDLAAHRKAHVIEYREAVLWSLLWVSLGIGFAFVIWAWQGPTAAGEYTAAWLLEKSLSVDNLFVFALIFAYFKVPREYQHRVLFYGVLGALVLRFVFIAAGVALLDDFSWVIYLFGRVPALHRIQDDQRLWRGHGPGQESCGQARPQDHPGDGRDTTASSSCSSRPASGSRRRW